MPRIIFVIIAAVLITNIIRGMNCLLYTSDMTILLIEHDMKLVSGICEALTVLNFGQVLAEGKTSDVLNAPKVLTACLLYTSLRFGCDCNSYCDNTGP